MKINNLFSTYFAFFRIVMNLGELINEAGKNKSQIVCVRCKSKILPPNMGTYEEIECELDCIEKDREGDKEILKEFFRVEDMFDFDNLGFTNTVENRKFLSCADCDLGPLGYHDLTTKLREDFDDKNICWQYQRNISFQFVELFIRQRYFNEIF